MLVKVFKTLDAYDMFDVESQNIKEILNHIKFTKSSEYTLEILENNYKYILYDSTKELPSIDLSVDSILFNLDGYDELYIIKELEGAVPITGAALVEAGVFASEGFAATASAFALNTVIMVGLSYGINQLMSMVSPTPTTGASKQSNLFNSSTLTRDQGGSMPIIFGNPFHGGVLISSSTDTWDI